MLMSNSMDRNVTNDDYMKVSVNIIKKGRCRLIVLSYDHCNNHF